MSVESPQSNGRPFQFRLSQLFWFVLILAVAIQQVLSPDWTLGERLLLICWFVGWMYGLWIGQTGGTGVILTATIGGTMCGFLGAIVLYFGFSDLVRRRSLPFHQEVLLPLVTLFVLAAVCSALFAASIYGVVYLSKRLMRVWQNHSVREVPVLAWLARAGAMLAIAAILISWFAPVFSWRPIAERHISGAAGGSRGAVAISADNNLLALGCQNGSVELWQLPALQRIARYNVDSKSGTECIEFSEVGAQLTCFSTYDPRIRMISVASGEQLNQVNTDAWALMAVSAAASGSELLIVVSCLEHQRLEISPWNVTTGTKMNSSILEVPGWAPVIHVERGLLAYLKWSGPGGTGRIGAESTISLHRLSDGRHLADGPTIRNVTSQFFPCFSHDGNWICMHSVVWNHQTQASHEIPGHGMCFLPDGRLLAVQTEYSRPVIQMDLTDWSVWLYRTPVVRRFLSGRSRSRVLVYDMKTRQTVLNSAWLREVGMVWVSPDGTRMATLTQEKLTIWNVPAN